MKETLEKLKASVVGKVKAYGAGIPLNQLAFIGDLLCSYVIEDGIIKQAVLTLSHKNGVEFEVSEELQEDIKGVFGPINVIFKRQYPNRGICLQYAFKVKEE